MKAWTWTEERRSTYSVLRVKWLGAYDPSVATFLMIFILQHSQNRDATAIQAKLDELILVSEASNKLIRAERLTDVRLRGIVQTSALTK